MLSALALLLLANHNAVAACPSTATQVHTDADVAYAAYAAFDVAGFKADASALRGEISCLSDTVDGQTAARVHLVMALDGWLAKDSSRMMSSFRGALAADPHFVLDEDMAPAGSQIRTFFDAARATGAGGTTPVGDEELTTNVDGRLAARAIPTERASLVQLAAPDADLRTWYLAGGPFPADLTAAIAAHPPIQTTGVQPAAPTVSPSRRSHASPVLLATGLAAGVAAGACLYVANGWKQKYEAAEGEEPISTQAYANNQTFGFTGYGVGAAAVGLGITAFIVGKW